MQRRSLLLTAPKRLEWITEDLPALQPGEVLIQTTSGAISIGTELPQYCVGQPAVQSQQAIPV